MEHPPLKHRFVHPGSTLPLLFLFFFVWGGGGGRETQPSLLFGDNSRSLTKGFPTILNRNLISPTCLQGSMRRGHSGTLIRDHWQKSFMSTNKLLRRLTIYPAVMERSCYPKASLPEFIRQNHDMAAEEVYAGIQPYWGSPMAMPQKQEQRPPRHERTNNKCTCLMLPLLWWLKWEGSFDVA